MGRATALLTVTVAVAVAAGCSASPSDGSPASDAGRIDAGVPAVDGATPDAGGERDAGATPDAAVPLTLTVETPDGECADLSVTGRTGPAARFVATGRPNATVQLWAEKPDCGVAPFLYEELALDDGGRATLDLEHAGSTSCTESLLGGWTTWLVHDAVRSNDAEVVFANAACTEAADCTGAGTFCPAEGPEAGWERVGDFPGLLIRPEGPPCPSSEPGCTERTTWSEYVETSGTYRVVRIRYRLVVPPDGWSQCLSLDSAGDVTLASKCLGTWITTRRPMLPANMLSYLMATRSGQMILRYGFGEGQLDKGKDVSGTGWGGLGPGTWDIEHYSRSSELGRLARATIEQVDGDRSLTIESSWTRGDGAPSHSFPDVFPDQPIFIALFWPGGNNPNEGASIGWAIRDLIVDVQR